MTDIGFLATWSKCPLRRIRCFGQEKFNQELAHELKILATLHNLRFVFLLLSYAWSLGSICYCLSLSFFLLFLWQKPPSLSPLSFPANFILYLMSVLSNLPRFRSSFFLPVRHAHSHADLLSSARQALIPPLVYKSPRRHQNKSPTALENMVIIYFWWNLTRFPL